MNAFDADAGEDGDFGGNGVVTVAVGGATLTGVFALRVFADNDPVEVFGIVLQLRQGNGGALEDSRRPDVDVLIQGVAEGQHHAPEGDVIRDIGPADGAKVDCVVLLELLHVVVGHVPLALEILFGGPVEGGELELKAAMCFGDGVQYLFCRFCYIYADSVLLVLSVPVYLLLQSRCNGCGRVMTYWVDVELTPGMAAILYVWAID